MTDIRILITVFLWILYAEHFLSHRGTSIAATYMIRVLLGSITESIVVLSCYGR